MSSSSTRIWNGSNEIGAAWSPSAPLVFWTPWVEGVGFVDDLRAGEVPSTPFSVPAFDCSWASAAKPPRLVCAGADGARVFTVDFGATPGEPPQVGQIPDVTMADRAFTSSDGRTVLFTAGGDTSEVVRAGETQGAWSQSVLAELLYSPGADIVSWIDRCDFAPVGPNAVCSVGQESRYDNDAPACRAAFLIGPDGGAVAVDGAWSACGADHIFAPDGSAIAYARGDGAVVLRALALSGGWTEERVVATSRASAVVTWCGTPWRGGS